MIKNIDVEDLEKKNIVYLFNREQRRIFRIINDLKYHINTNSNHKNFMLQRLEELERIVDVD